MVAERNPQRNGELVARLEQYGEVAGHVSDVSTEDFAEPLAAATVERFGGIDVVINNAATYPSRPWNEYTLEEWDRTIDTNLRSLFLMSKATVPHIAARGGGSIANIRSITFALGTTSIIPYVTSRARRSGCTLHLSTTAVPRAPTRHTPGPARQLFMTAARSATPAACGPWTAICGPWPTQWRPAVMCAATTAGR